MRVWSLIGLITCALAVSVANASVTGWNCQADGDGAVVCQTNLTGSAPDYTMNIVENMYGTPGHVEGTITTDTLLDPSINFNKSVTNDTTFAWSDYHFNMFMQQPFSITGVGPMPLGWTAVVTAVNTTAGSYEDSHHNPFAYQGAVDFYNTSGSNVAIGQMANFGAIANFSGYSLYSFEIEQIATPEPVSLALLALGGLFIRRNRKVSRQARQDGPPAC